MASRRGISSFAATVLVGLALALALFFMWRVWKYYDQIVTGQMVELPQFTAQFTPAGASGGTAAAGARPEATASDDPSVGPADAKLTVVEFVDYQCPYCAEEASLVRELMNAYKDSVRFVIRDFPVQELHPDAVAGAEAAGCAQAQDKFWQMHDRLFSLKGQLPRADLDRAAEQSGLDMPVFAACMDTHARLDEIQGDAADGVNAGVRGTPTFFFNGRKAEGVIPRDVFETIIKRSLSS